MATKLDEIKMMSYICKKTGIEKGSHHQVQFDWRYRVDYAGNPLCQTATKGSRGSFCREESFFTGCGG